MYVPKNREVKTPDDVWKVITYSILHHDGLFTIAEVEEDVEKHLKFSYYGKYGKFRKSIDLPSKIEVAMSGMVRKGYIQKAKGECFRVSVSFDKLYPQEEAEKDS